MKQPKIATIKNEEGTLLVRTPYRVEEFVDAINDEEVIPRKERVWERPVWKVHPKHLEYIRQIVASVANEQGWKILDYTLESQVEIDQRKQSIAVDYMEQHVNEILAVIPKLPERALRLVGWDDNTLRLELAIFLNDQDLYTELVKASLEAFRPEFRVPGYTKETGARIFIWSDDDRIIRALCTYAGYSLGYGSNVEHLWVRDLKLGRSFPDGVAHFTGEDGSFWIGFPVNKVNVDLSQDRLRDWQMAVTDTSIYHLFDRQKHVERLIKSSESRYVNPGFGNVAVAQSHPSYVAAFVRDTHIETWFYEWGNHLIISDTLTKKRGHYKHSWYRSDWSHPVDELLSHISGGTRAGIPEMLALLGWDYALVQEQRRRIQQLKEEVAQRVIEDVRQRAAELAQPMLEALTISELLELGQKHNINVKRSWGKLRIIAELAKNSPVCEETIGLTKRLGERDDT